MKSLKVKTFGMLAEKLPASDFEFPYFENSEELLKALNEEFPMLKTMNFSLAVNRQLVQKNIPLEGNEEIALLPPFSGG